MIINIGKLHFRSSWYKKPSIPIIGISNRCPESWYIPFIDYDAVQLEVVEEDLKHIAKEFNICTFAILTTKEEEIGGKIIGNYHVMAFCKMFRGEHFNMLYHTACDKGYPKVPHKYSRADWVLRISSKGKRDSPQLLKIIKFGSCNREHSLSHLKWFNDVHESTITLKNMDANNSSPEFVEYLTR